MENIVTFHKVYPDAISPMRSDKTALGTLPASGYQFCEAVRAASGFGWYVFPPMDIHLRWDGAQIYFKEAGAWTVLSSIVYTDFHNYWNEHAPEAHKDRSPPFLSELFIPGLVQIWTGLLVSTIKDWSVLVRPMANIVQSRQYNHYEGIVETDWFKPIPLFINIRLIDTSTEIIIPKNKPLFQVQPIHRMSYTTASAQYTEYVGLEPRNGDVGGMSPEDWQGLSNTVRSVMPDGSHMVGRYGAEVRKRNKHCEPD